MRKRSKLYVDHQLQGAMVFRLVVHWCATILCLFLFSFMLTAIFHLFSDSALTFGDLVRGFLQRHLLFFLVLGALAPLFIWDMIKVSHRIAGPAFRLRRELRELAQGHEAESIEFREADFWRDLATNFNLVRDELLYRRGDDFSRATTAGESASDDAESERDVAAFS